MKIALFGRHTKTTNAEVLRDFLHFLSAEGVHYLIYAPYCTELKERGVLDDSFHAPTYETLDEVRDVAFLYSIGGDGTILDAVRFIGRAGIPILGVNAGRLGFLASVSQYELKLATTDLLRNNWKVDERTMVTVETRPGVAFGGYNFGLNEVTIHKANTNEMIVVHTFINGEFLNSYWTDGLVISTPTGSTAYSLACGGPIMSPRSNSFVLTPIAPHSLTVRPIVIADNSIVSFEIESRSGQALVAVDNRTELIPDSTEIAVKRADFNANLVKLNSRSYFSTLRNRLNWGFDIRN